MAANKSNPRKDLLFHALVSARRMKEGIGRSLRYTFPHPQSAVSAESLANAPGCIYETLAPPEEHILSIPKGLDPAIRHRFEQINAGCIPERFILEIENGRVFSEGHVITADNRLVSDVSPYFSQHRHHWLLGIGKLPEPTRIKGTVAVLDSPGSSNYFHWTLDTLPRMNLLRHHIGKVDWFYIGNSAPFQQAWLRKLGIPPEKILPVAPRAHIEAEHLLIPSFSHRSGLYSHAAYSYVRSFLPAPTRPMRKIYISRSNARRRRIQNEAAILPILKQQDFEVHQMAGMTVDQQMELFGSASHIIAPHGAELTNLVYCQPGTKVLEIFSPYYINLCYTAMASQLGLDYSCLLGNGGAKSLRREKTHLQVWRNIHVDTDRLKPHLTNPMEAQP